MINGHRKRLARFSVFEFDLDSGELLKQGARIHLQAKPLRILQTLLEKPGSVVTREELKRRLWAEDTFVDFESGLNTAANRLRLRLGDSADKPLYIETLPRVGYRFVAPVEKIDWKPPKPQPRRPIGRRLTMVSAIGALVPLLAIFFYLSRPKRVEVKFRQITFRRGQVSAARFAPDGRGILYTAQWDKQPRQMFLTHALSPESRPMGFQEMSLASVSRRGELALLAFGGTMNINGGRLSRVPMNGGAPSQVDQSIMSADWSSDGSQLAIVRAIDGRNQLEYPLGKVLYRTPGWLSSPRIAPDNDSIALLDHPVRHDDSGRVMLIDRNGGSRVLSEGWATCGGLAWHPSKREIWFTASREGSPRSLWAVTTKGALRSVAQAPGVLTLQDISPEGHVLVKRETRRLEMAGQVAGSHSERDLSWLDWSRVQNLSPDGKLILFDESGEAAGANHQVYLHRIEDGSKALLLSRKAIQS